jgi:hypothetical protein
MTKQQAEELAREAQSERAWHRDHALEIWQTEYERRFPRPANVDPE